MSGISRQSSRPDSVARFCPRRFRQRVSAEHIGDFVRMNGDEAHRPFGCETAEFFAHPHGRQAEAARAQHIDGDEIAVTRFACATLGDDEFARPRVALVDRHDAAATGGVGAENAEHLRLGALEKFYDTAGIGRLVRPRLAREFRADKAAIANAWSCDAGTAAAEVNQNFRDWPLGAVPFDGLGDQFAVRVALYNFGENDGRQLAGLMQLFAAALNGAFRFEFFEYLL